jgi:hypothetical protein
MKARDIVGRRVVAVNQSPITNTAGDIIWAIIGFQLDNGTTIHFYVEELHGDYAVGATTHRTPEAQAKGERCRTFKSAPTGR